MKHIRSSIKGIFLLENEGTPTLTVTDFGESIPQGSQCIDKTNNINYTFNGSTWFVSSENRKTVSVVGSTTTTTDHPTGITTSKRTFIWESLATSGAAIFSPDLTDTTLTTNQAITVNLTIITANAATYLKKIMSFERVGSGNITQVSEDQLAVSGVDASIDLVANTGTQSLRLTKGSTLAAMDIIIIYEYTKYTRG